MFISEATVAALVALVGVTCSDDSRRLLAPLDLVCSAWCVNAFLDGLAQRLIGASACDATKDARGEVEALVSCALLLADRLLEKGDAWARVVAAALAAAPDATCHAARLASSLKRATSLS